MIVFSSGDRLLVATAGGDCHRHRQNPGQFRQKIAATLASQPAARRIVASAEASQRPIWA